MTEDWRTNLIESRADIADLLDSARRIAVLGIKTERQPGQPAFYVPEYLQSAGYEVVPIPVYYPDVTEILGQEVYRSVASVPGPIDLVVVFRRPQDLGVHLEDLLQARPAAVWLQSGIQDDGFARTLAESGIRVVQNRCAMTEHHFARRG